MDRCISEFFQEEMEIEREEYRDTPAYNRFYNFCCERVNPIYANVSEDFLKDWCQILGLGKDFIRIFDQSKVKNKKSFLDLAFKLLYLWVSSKNIKDLSDNIRKFFVQTTFLDHEAEGLTSIARIVLERFDEYGVQLKIKNEYDIKA